MGKYNYHVTYFDIKIAGMLDVTGGRRRSKQILNDLKEKRGYWNLKEEALYRKLWRTRFGSGYGTAVNEIIF
jgi:hypothetical protein